jgi:hypothetical protein
MTTGSPLPYWMRHPLELGLSPDPSSNAAAL